MRSSAKPRRREHSQRRTTYAKVNEHHTISICSEAEAIANRRFIRIERVDLDAVLVLKEEDEEALPSRPAINNHDTDGSCVNIVDISNDDVMRNS